MGFFYHFCSSVKWEREMKFKVKYIFVISGIIFFILVVAFLESKKESLFSENIIAEVSEQVGEDIDGFFMPMQKDFREVLDWYKDEDLSLGNETYMIEKWYGLFISNPAVSAVICKDSGGREFIMYKDKGSYVTNFREIPGENDSVYVWKRFKNPDQEIGRWNEIMKLNTSKVSGDTEIENHSGNDVSWSGNPKSVYTGKPVLRGTFFLDKTKNVAIEIPVSKMVEALTRFRWYRDRRIFIETTDGDYIQIPALKDDTLVFISKTNLPEFAANDSVYYFITQSLKLVEAGNIETHTFDLDNNRWWIQTTQRYPVSYGIAIKEDQLLAGKIKQNLYYILGIIFVILTIVIFLYFRRRNKLQFSEPPDSSSVKEDDYWLNLIQKGENARIEFKSTLRWDLNENTVNQKLEEVVLKTIAAFNNGEGGMLVIGANDNGEVLGLEDDFNSLKKYGTDYFELHLRNLLNSQFGISFTTNNIHIEFPDVTGKQICVIHVEKGKQPLFVELADKSGRKSEKFYVRSGNSSQEISSLSELNTYINSRFSANTY